MTRFVPVSDPRVAVMGRVERPEPGRIRFGYPGVTLRVRFEGPSLAMRVSARRRTATSTSSSTAARPASSTRARATATSCSREDLGPGAHSVDVVHRTETWMSIVDVRGFLLAPGGRLLDPHPWPKRRMLFVGDSVTCGERIDRQPGETEPFASSNGYSLVRHAPRPRPRRAVPPRLLRRSRPRPRLARPQRRPHGPAAVRPRRGRRDRRPALGPRRLHARRRLRLPRHERLQPRASARCPSARHSSPRT